MNSNISSISVDRGNSWFSICRTFLLDSAGHSLIQSFSRESYVILFRSIETLSRYCFSGSKQLSILIFESSSTLRQIDESAFRDCSSIESICIPSSVEIIGDFCFDSCRSL
jgi:hypothetical protein